MVVRGRNYDDAFILAKKELVEELFIYSPCELKHRFGIAHRVRPFGQLFRISLYYRFIN